MLRALSDMPRNDWVEEVVVTKVVGVIPTPSAPRALQFLSRDGGYRCISFDEVVEVVGTFGPPRTEEEATRPVKKTRRVRRSKR